MSCQLVTALAKDIYSDSKAYVTRGITGSCTPLGEY
jgi:hypothetical protein